MKLPRQPIALLLLIMVYFHTGFSQTSVFQEEDFSKSYTQAKKWYEEALKHSVNEPGMGLSYVERGLNSLAEYSWGGSSEEALILKVDLCNLGGSIKQDVGDHRAAVAYFRKAVGMSELLQYEKGLAIATQHLAEIRYAQEKQNKELKGIARWGKNVENSFNQFFDQNTIEKNIKDLEKLAIEQMASLQTRRKDYEKALNHQEKLLRMYEVEKDSLKAAETRHEIARIYHMKGDFGKALDYTYLTTDLPDSNIIVISVDPMTPKAPIVRRENWVEASASSESESEETRSIARATPTPQLPPTPQISPNTQVPEVRRRYEKLKRQITDFKIARNLDSLELAHKLTEQKMEVELLRTESEKQAAEMQRERFRMMAGTGLLVLALLFFIGLLLLRNRSHKRLAKAYNDLDFAHRKLKMAQTKLVESEKLASLGQLTAGIAHEINNPVNFISGNIGPLQRDLNDIYAVLQAYEQTIQEYQLEDKFEEVDELKEDLEINFLTEEINSLIAGINEGATRTSQIVKGLRTFARMDEEVKKPFDIHQGIDSTLTLLNHQCKQIELKKEYGDLPNIEAFPGKLNQVFMNVLTNAIQAMDGKGKIQIETNMWKKDDLEKQVSGNIQTLFTADQEPASEFIQVSVKDSGKGIPEDIKQRIFEPFFTTKDVGEGTGLGLPICKGIVEDHEGTIEIFSEEGKGTEVRIVLPVNQVKETI